MAAKSKRSCLGSAEDIRKVFNKFDKNGDGKICRNELREILSALGSSETAANDEVTKMMHELDKDGDGYIDFDEFADHFQGEEGSQCGGGSMKDLKDAFDMYDLDGNGLISVKELHSVLKKLGEKSSIGECKKMISQVDVDGDGHVNFEEFKKMMSH